MIDNGRITAPISKAPHKRQVHMVCRHVTHAAGHTLICRVCIGMAIAVPGREFALLAPRDEPPLREEREPGLSGLGRLRVLFVGESAERVLPPLALM